MNNTDDDKLKSLQYLNATIKQFNTLLEDLLKSRREDKMNWLRVLNADFKEVNTILVDILESRKKDTISNELHQTVQ